MAMWSLLKKKEKKESEATTLADIIRGIQYCVNSACEIVERHYMDVSDKYFDGAGKPVSRRFFINDHHVMDIPEIALQSHCSLQLDEMVVKMNLEIKNLDVKSTKVPTSSTKSYDMSRSSFEVEPASPENKKGTHMEIEMKFKAGEPPEAVSRMIEQLNNSVVATHINDLIRSE